MNYIEIFDDVGLHHCSPNNSPQTATGPQFLVSVIWYIFHQNWKITTVAEVKLKVHNKY